MIRPETRARARALQMLYSVEMGGAADVRQAATRLARLTGPDPLVFDQAEALAGAVMADCARLDRHVAEAAEHWRLERVAVVERNILRLAMHELLVGVVPPKVVIDEALQLAHWFGGSKAPAFVNGVLDRAARELGRL